MYDEQCVFDKIPYNDKRTIDSIARANAQINPIIVPIIHNQIDNNTRLSEFVDPQMHGFFDDISGGE